MHIEFIPQGCILVIYARQNSKKRSHCDKSSALPGAESSALMNRLVAPNTSLNTRHLSHSRTCSTELDRPPLRRGAISNPLVSVASHPMMFSLLAMPPAAALCGGLAVDTSRGPDKGMLSRPKISLALCIPRVLITSLTSVDQPQPY